MNTLQISILRRLDQVTEAPESTFEYASATLLLLINAEYINATGTGHERMLRITTKGRATLRSEDQSPA